MLGREKVNIIAGIGGALGYFRKGKRCATYAGNDAAKGAQQMISDMPPPPAAA